MIALQQRLATLALHTRARTMQLPEARARLLALVDAPAAERAHPDLPARVHAAIGVALVTLGAAVAQQLDDAGPAEPIAAGAAAAGATDAGIDLLGKALTALAVLQDQSVSDAVMETYGETGLDLAALQQRLLAVSTPYLQGRTALAWTSLDELPPELRSYWGDDARATRLAIVAAATTAYHQLADLDERAPALAILGATELADDDRQVTAALVHAERRAREHARVARVLTGAIPIAARRAYARARATDAATLDGKHEALSWYWRSSEASRLVAMLARD